MATKHTQLLEFVSKNAVLRGEYKLSSGASSDYYIDGKQILSRPLGLQLVADAVIEELKGHDVSSVGGLEIGAIYIAAAVSLRSLEGPKPIPLFTVRKLPKVHGTRKQIEGIVERGNTVAIVDDVVTTGGSVVQAIEAVEGIGCKVAVAISVVDRDSGARELIERHGIPYCPLMTISDLGLSNDQYRNAPSQKIADRGCVV